MIIKVEYLFDACKKKHLIQRLNENKCFWMKCPKTYKRYLFYNSPVSEVYNLCDGHAKPYLKNLKELTEKELFFIKIHT